MTIGMASMAGGFMMVVVVLFGLWLWARILAKAGFSSWWALLALIPVVNPLAIWVFASGDRIRGIPLDVSGLSTIMQAVVVQGLALVGIVAILLIMRQLAIRRSSNGGASE